MTAIATRDLVELYISRSLRLVGLGCFLISALAVAASHTQANAFQSVNLPRGVVIELPSNFVVISENKRMTLHAYSEAMSQRVFSGDRVATEFPFAANLYTDDGQAIALVNVRYYPKLDFAQSDVQGEAREIARALDPELKRSLQLVAREVPFKITAWHGTEARIINGLTTFLTTYERTSIKDNSYFLVRLVRIFAGEQSHTLTVSYRRDHEFMLRPISDHIINSLRLKDR